MVECFLKVKVWDLVIIVGIIIGIIGCFLPWGKEIPSIFYPRQNVEVGTHFSSGVITLIGLISATVLQLVFMIKRKVYMIIAVLFSGLVTLSISGSWILLVPTTSYGTIRYTVLYGVYVTLLGAMIVSAMAFVYIAATAEKQLSLGKSKQTT